MPHYALELEYDGRAFAGTQAQAIVRTLQGVMESALTELNGAPVGFRASSRLDAGVSALALPGDCQLERAWREPELAHALNAHLPADVVVRRVAIVADDWSARRSATKTYRYLVLHRPVRPVLDLRALWVRHLPYPERLHEAAALLPGDRDLSGFASKRGDSRDDQSPRRRYLSAQWTCAPGDGEMHWTFRITGEGFLYKQVRALVGAMVFIAQDRGATLDDFRTSIAHGWGAPRIGNLARAEGLLLETVRYAPEPAWVWG